MDASETALLLGGAHDGREVRIYPGQCRVTMPTETYLLHRVHDSRGFHRLIGQLPDDHRGPMQALYEGYKKENEHAC